MAVVYPLYAPGGYARIGEVKYFFFRNVTLVMLAAAGGVIVLAALVRRDREWIVKQYRRMSVTDWLVYGYCLTVMLSYLCSDYKEDALWGVQGWYMGVMSQLMFALLYFSFRGIFAVGMGKRQPAGELSRQAAGRGQGRGAFLYGNGWASGWRHRRLYLCWASATDTLCIRSGWRGRRKPSSPHWAILTGTAATGR